MVSHEHSDFAIIRMQQKFVLTSFAVLASIMGLAFIKMAAFAYLQSIWGPLWTPLLVGLAKELHKLSGNALEAEFQSGQKTLPRQR